MPVPVLLATERGWASAHIRPAPPAPHRTCLCACVCVRACVETQAVPSCFAFLGTRNELIGAVHSLHNPRFKLDEGVLPLGAALHAAWAVRYLERRSAELQSLGDTP